MWVIIGISKTDIHGEKTYYYGSDYSNSHTRNPREIVRNLDHIDLPLAGKRTIYQKVFEKHCSMGNAPNYFTNFSQYIQDISTLFDSFFNQLQFNHAIEYGSAYYKISPLSSTYDNDRQLQAQLQAETERMIEEELDRGGLIPPLTYEELYGL